MLTYTPTWSLPAGNTVVPSRWQATASRAYTVFVATANALRLSARHRPSTKTPATAR